MPSDTSNQRLLNAMGCEKKGLQSFQYRGTGWPGFATVVDIDGKQYRMDYQSVWGNYLGWDVKKIYRYYVDGIGELADITCADLCGRES